MNIPINIKGIIYIDSHGYRGLGDNLIEYLKSCTKLLGGEYSLEKFKIENNMILFENKIINLDEYSHIFFCYRCDVKDLPIYNKKKQPHLSGFNYTKFSELEDFFRKNTNLTILNKVSNSKYDYDRLEFFELMKKNNIKVPDYQVIYEPNFTKEQIENKLNNIKINYPLLLRTDTDYGGLNIYYIKNSEILKSSFYQLLNIDHTDITRTNKNKKIIITEFVNSYNEELRCNITARVVLVKDKILCYLVEAYNKDKWIYKIKDTNINYVYNNKVNTNKLEHFKDALPEKNIRKLQTNSYLFIKEYVRRHVNIFKNLYNIIGLDTISIDFLPLNNEPLILECGIKQGLSNYKLDIIKNNVDVTKYVDIVDYSNNNLRNSIIVNNLFKKKNIYCDIDNTICDNTVRLLKYNRNNKINYDLMSSDDILNDTMIINSNYIINLLYKNYNIIFITARKRIPDYYNITKLWLEKNNFHYNDIIFCDKLGDKPYILKDLNVDIFIDDLCIGYEKNLKILATNTIKKLDQFHIKYYIFKDNWMELLNILKN